MNDEELGTRLEEAFRTHARDMYRGVGLAAEARKRVRRRRTALTTAAAVVLMVGVGTAWGSAVGFRLGSDDAVSTGGAGDSKAVPAPERQAEDQDTGWRWESYGGLQVQVPAGWGYGVTDFPWCSQQDLRTAMTGGEVGRPGPYGYVRCKEPAPLTALRQHVWLSPAQDTVPSSVQLGDGWVRDVFVVGKVKIEVQTHADQVLRQRIKDSIRTAGTDAYGCPVTHPAAVPRVTRPAGGLDWSVPGVTGVSICSYKVDAYGGVQPLFASASRDAAGAIRLLDTIRAAPAGGGPDDLKADPDKLGSDLTVLRFGTAVGVREVYVRYSGSRHNGFDNGTQVRRLTKPALSFLTGALVVRQGPTITAGLLPRR